MLKGLESGEIKLDDGVDSKAFFAMLLQNTKEGYFSDPIYGGNKDMAAWKMIGFPGRALRLQGMGLAPRRARALSPRSASRAAPAGRRPEHGHHAQTCRCGAGGLRLDRRHHGPAALRRRT